MPGMEARFSEHGVKVVITKHILFSQVIYSFKYISAYS